MSDGIYVEGLNKTVKALTDLGVEISDMKEAFSKIGANALREIKTLTPVKSGKLQNSEKASKRKNAAIITAGGAKVQYAAVQNFGWPGHGIEPHLFMQKGVSNTQAQTLSILEEELNRIIGKTGLN